MFILSSHRSTWQVGTFVLSSFLQLPQANGRGMLSEENSGGLLWTPLPRRFPAQVRDGVISTLSSEFGLLNGARYFYCWSETIFCRFAWLENVTRELFLLSRRDQKIHGPKFSSRARERTSPIIWIYRNSEEAAVRWFVTTPTTEFLCAQCHRYTWSMVLSS